ncbi:pilus assembly PilX family protein [Noviherbaspirillum aridicola]|nr:pilus assembly PilX N-terminal domain-containing protein [Noviherbaspirillum aridicola]
MTLVVALIMLVLITLLVVTSANLGQGSLQTVGNMQHRNEVYAAAQATIEEAISSTRFFDNPANVLVNACDGVSNQRCIDTNGDGTHDVKVQLTPAPTCVMVQAVKNDDLEITSAEAEDLGCAVGQGQNSGIVGAATGDSMCSNSTWEIHALASDMVTEAKTEITQGVAVRVSNDAISTACP